MGKSPIRKEFAMHLILASASPRRREILETLGVPFVIHTADADESCDIADPGARVETIAARKCMAALESLRAEEELPPDTVILAADTLVAVDGEFLGKPGDAADAARMVALLQGKTHMVASGICLWYGGRTVTSHELTGVTFAPMTAAEIATYIATGESFGKAGAYAIQGYAARFISRISGDYFNVVGLPVHCLYRTLDMAFGIKL